MGTNTEGTVFNATSTKPTTLESSDSTDTAITRDTNLTNQTKTHASETQPTSEPSKSVTSVTSTQDEQSFSTDASNEESKTTQAETTTQSIPDFTEKGKTTAKQTAYLATITETSTIITTSDLSISSTVSTTISIPSTIGASRISSETKSLGTSKTPAVVTDMIYIPYDKTDPASNTPSSSSTAMVLPGSRGQVATISTTDCSTIVGVTVGIASIVVVLVILASLFYVLRTRKRWKKKVRDERLKTDIWSMSTFHNTIVNDNFSDYNLAQPTKTNFSMKSKFPFRKSNNSSRKSNKTLERSSSIYTDTYSLGQLNTSSRRNTFTNADLSRIAKQKMSAQRQLSSNSTDFFLDQSAEARSRSNTFTSGKRYKRDLHVLVNHDELDNELGAMHVDTSIPSREFYVTEL